jgi:hypothetical protein
MDLSASSLIKPFCRCCGRPNAGLPFSRAVHHRPCRVLLVKALYRKEMEERSSSLLTADERPVRPSLYHSYHQIVPLVVESPHETVDVVGPLCDRATFSRWTVRCRACSGNTSRCVCQRLRYVLSSNYNSRVVPPKCSLTTAASVIRNRETIEQL